MASTEDLRIVKLFLVNAQSLDVPTRMPVAELVKELEGPKEELMHLISVDQVDGTAHFALRREFMVGYSIFKPSARMVQPPGPSIVQ